MLLFFLHILLSSFFSFQLSDKFNNVVIVVDALKDKKTGKVE